MKVNDTDPRVSAMAEDWQLIDALLGGTRAMRAAGTRYMPRFGLEDVADYKARLSLATLFPAMEQTLREMTGRVFAEEIGVQDVLPWIVDEVWPNIDMQDANGHVFGREWWRCSLAYGLAHVLVESPMAPEVRTQADQRASGVRPYCILLHPSRVLGWQVGTDGALSQLRLTWSRTEPGEFGAVTIEQIRVYETRPGTTVWVRVFEKRKQGNEEAWIEVEQIETGADFIPLATFYTGKTATLEAVPPLRELAYLNAKHWAQQCSTDALLQVASVPILCAIGIDDETSIAIGAKSAVKISNPNGKLAFVEHSGAAIGAGRQSLLDLEQQMKAIGAKLIEQGAATKTATQAGEEAASSNSVLGGWVRDFRDAMNALLDIIASYRGEESGGTVEINADLDPDSVPNETMTVLGKMVATGGLSRQTQFAEAQRRGLVSSELTWEDEQARIETEGPSEPEPAQVTP